MPDNEKNKENLPQNISRIWLVIIMLFLYLITLLITAPAGHGGRCRSPNKISPFHGYLLKRAGGLPPAAGNEINTIVLSHLWFSPEYGQRCTPNAGCEINPPNVQRINGQTAEQNIPLNGPEGWCHGGPAPLNELQKTEDRRQKTEDRGRRTEDWLDELVDKIWIIESSGQITPPDGDGGLAVGPLQLHKGIVDDINRFYGTAYIYNDRRDLQKSRQMAKMYVSYWLYDQREEIAARIFNGGPRGWRKQGTNEYWEKIQKNNATEGTENIEIKSKNLRGEGNVNNSRSIIRISGVFVGNRQID